ncbi:protease HtpX [bacterium]|nr:protease HtpX [bacterium]
MFSWMKRIFLFGIVNILIIVTISMVLNLLGVQPYMTAYGIDYGQLALFCLVWGSGGALISLALSRIMAKMMMGVRVIDPQTGDPVLRDLVMTVHKLARGANLPAMPEVGIYESPEVNAFATGPSKSRSLVAVSSGLLQRMNKGEVEGVLGHEIAHVANGDMVTMTLIQGIVNAFVMFFARILAFVLANAMRSSDDERSGPSPMVMYLATMVFEILFSLLGMMVVAYFSRWREFRADQGGAGLAGREKMIGALEALRRGTQQIDESHPSLATLKISGRPGGLMALLASHPPLEVRIERLRKMM